MPALNVHLPPPPKPTGGRPRFVFFFLVTFIAVFLAAMLVMEWL